MSKELKAIRGQLRQITKELLPDMLSQELKTEIYNSMKGEMLARLTMIETNVREHLTRLDERQKDTLGYLVRSISTPTIEVPDSSAPAPVAPLENYTVLEPKSE